MAGMESELCEGDLGWTIVRPPPLIGNLPLEGRSQRPEAR